MNSFQLYNPVQTTTKGLPVKRHWLEGREAGLKLELGWLNNNINFITKPVLCKTFYKKSQIIFKIHILDH